MILEIAGCLVMSGILSYTVFEKDGLTDASKIQRIAVRAGLTTKAEGKVQTIQPLRRTRHSWGTEYVFRIPLGLSFEDFQRRKQTFEDGLNHKRSLIDISLEDIKRLQLRADLLEQVKQLLAGKKYRKEILLEYDGALRIRVYREPLPELVPFDDTTLAGCRGWSVCVGLSREGVVYHDFDTIPHLVVAGTTTYGKSVFLKNVVATLIHSQPDAVRFALIDLKGGLAFNRFANVLQVDTVAKDPEEALEALRAIRAEMKQRQDDFLSCGYENVREARLRARRFIIVDEGAELASAGETDKEMKRIKVECEKALAEIARIGGSLGYRLIYATQYPTADTLPRQVKQNADARLCFRLQTEIASHVVLDESGAERLPYVKGRAIYRTDRKRIVQTPFIENDFIDRTIRPYITIRPRKEETNESADRTGRSYTLVIEES